MKRLSLSILTAVALLAAMPLAAQAGSSNPQTSQPSNPHSMDQMNQGRTLEGTVISVSESSLELRTDNGPVTIQLAKDTILPEDVTGGTRVEVSLKPQPEGSTESALVAKQVVLSPPPESATVQQEPSSSRSMTGTEESSTTAAATTDTDSDVEGRSLPQTASHQPLVALLSLLALSAALALSVLRRRRAA